MKTLFITIILLAMLALSGCSDDSADDFTNDPINNSGQTSTGSRGEESRVTIDKRVESPKEIKIAEILPDAHNSEAWVIYLLPETLEFESRNPHQFRCKVRIVTIEDDAVATVELTPRLTTYEFFENGGEIYYRSVNYFNWKNSGKVKGSAFAERIYKYVSKNF